MPKLGILFDIEELGGGLYGMAAYKVLFSAIDTRRLAGCALSDGDTNETLSGRANHYCIAVDAPDGSQISLVRQTLSRSNAKGLLPLPSRFLEDAQVQSEPLVAAAQVTATGEIVGGGWISAAWKQAQGEVDRPAIQSALTPSAGFCVKCGHTVTKADGFCPKCGAAQTVDGAGPELGLMELQHIYTPASDLAKVPTGQVERFKKNEFLTTFPTGLAILLHFFTLGVFTVIFHGLKHSKLPMIRHDDFRGGKAIGYLFIPFYNLYWYFIFWQRLADRLNFQLRLRGIPEGVNRGLVTTACVLTVIPYIGLIAWVALWPVVSAQVQSASNRLAELKFQGGV